MNHEWARWEGVLRPRPPENVEILPPARSTASVTALRSPSPRKPFQSRSARPNRLSSQAMSTAPGPAVPPPVISCGTPRSNSQSYRAFSEVVGRPGGRRPGISISAGRRPSFRSARKRFTNRSQAMFHRSGRARFWKWPKPRWSSAWARTQVHSSGAARRFGWTWMVPFWVTTAQPPRGQRLCSSLWRTTCARMRSGTNSGCR